MVVFEGLGRALRFLRDQKRRSQKQVAEAAGVTPPMVSAYENERTVPELETLDKILQDGLGASLVELSKALDIVNGRPPAGGAGPSVRQDDPELSALLAPPATDAAGRPLPPEIRRGFSELTRGLLRVHRYALEAALSEAEERSGRPGGGGESRGGRE